MECGKCSATCNTCWKVGRSCAEEDFVPYNSFGMKIDFEFSSKKSLCSINDFEHLSKISVKQTSATISDGTEYNLRL